MGKIKEDLIGKKFGHWTVLEYKGNDKHKHKIYLCECDCEKHTKKL